MADGVGTLCANTHHRASFFKYTVVKGQNLRCAVEGGGWLQYLYPVISTLENNNQTETAHFKVVARKSYIKP